MQKEKMVMAERDSSQMFVEVLYEMREMIRELASKDSKMRVTCDVLCDDKKIGSVSFDMDI